MSAPAPLLGNKRTSRIYEYATYQTTISDLLSGQHSDPLRVIRFNPDTDSCEDASRAMGASCCAVALDARPVPPALADFIDRHVVEPDGQLNLASRPSLRADRPPGRWLGRASGRYRRGF